MRLDAIVLIVLVMLWVVLSIAKGIIIAGGPNGVTLPFPKWLVRFVLGERQTPRARTH